MAEVEEAFTDFDYSVPRDRTPSAPRLDGGDAARIDRIEHLAERAGVTLMSSLPHGTRARAELNEVVAEVLSLQDQIVEWGRLHHLLHEVLIAFGWFRAGVAFSATGGLGLAERHSLLQNWQMCQGRMGALEDFAEGIAHIGSPFRPTEQTLHGEPWVVEIVALRSLLEDTLKEENPDLPALRELAEDFYTTCQHQMVLADGQMLAAAGHLRRLFRHLFGPELGRL